MNNLSRLLVIVGRKFRCCMARFVQFCNLSVTLLHCWARCKLCLTVSAETCLFLVNYVDFYHVYYLWIDVMLDCIIVYLAVTNLESRAHIFRKLLASSFCAEQQQCVYQLTFLFKQLASTNSKRKKRWPSCLFFFTHKIASSANASMSYFYIFWTHVDVVIRGLCGNSQAYNYLNETEYIKWD